MFTAFSKLKRFIGVSLVEGLTPEQSNTIDLIGSPLTAVDDQISPTNLADVTTDGTFCVRNTPADVASFGLADHVDGDVLKKVGTTWKRILRPVAGTTFIWLTTFGKQAVFVDEPVAGNLPLFVSTLDPGEAFSVPYIGTNLPGQISFDGTLFIGNTAGGLTTADFGNATVLLLIGTLVVWIRDTVNPERSGVYNLIVNNAETGDYTLRRDYNFRDSSSFTDGQTFFVGSGSGGDEANKNYLISLTQQFVINTTSLAIVEGNIANLAQLTAENHAEKLLLSDNNFIVIAQPDGSLAKVSPPDFAASLRSNNAFSDPTKKVIILYIGQSNAGGAAAVSELPDFLKSIDSVTGTPRQGKVGGWDAYNNTANVQKNTLSFVEIHDLIANADTNIPSRGPSQGTGFAGGVEIFFATENLYIIKCAIGATEFKGWLLEEGNRHTNVIDRSLRPTLRTLVGDIITEGFTPVLGAIIMQHGESTASVETDPDVINFDTEYMIESYRRSLGFKTATLSNCPIIFSRPVHDVAATEINRTIMFDGVKLLAQSDSQIMTVDVRDTELGFPLDPTGDNEHLNTASYEVLSRECKRLIIERSQFPEIKIADLQLVEKPDLTVFDFGLDFEDLVNPLDNIGLLNTGASPDVTDNAAVFVFAGEGRVLDFFGNSSSAIYNAAIPTYVPANGQSFAFRVKTTTGGGTPNIMTVGSLFINRIQGVRLSGITNIAPFRNVNFIDSNFMSAFVNIGFTLIAEAGQTRVTVFINGFETNNALLDDTTTDGNLVLGNIAQGNANGISGDMAWFMAHNQALSSAAMIALTRLR